MVDYIRRVDELGRVIIPIEIRRALRIHEKDSLRIFQEDQRIVLEKTQEEKTQKEQAAQ